MPGKENLYRWRKKEPREIDATYIGPAFSEPPAEVPSPYEYFKLFIDDSILNDCCHQTNLYATQKAVAKGSRIPFTTTKEKIEQFFGSLLYMGICKFPSYVMYWSPETRVGMIADHLTKNDFEAIKANIHFNDNSQMPQRDDANYDPIYKVRPLVENVRENCLKIEPEERHSVDEMIIPTKTRWGIKQYNPKKPSKWGIKLFSRCGVSGLIYDFSVYLGAKSRMDEKLVEKFGNSGAVVAQLCKSLPEKLGHKVYCDNFFHRQVCSFI